MKLKTGFRYAIALILTAFGLITLFLSSSVVFDLFGIRAKEGNYVLFVVIANMISSILYLLAVYGIILKKIWTTKILSISAGVLIIAFIGLFVHINTGGIYETKTIGAMVFRILLTLGFTISAHFIIKKTEK
ncbi:MAG: hypothetical protein COW63_11705 [Bacteroidetes bacterium CG18_big_fil_WC_8_21_14_2_50_41_14]|nr:MAG: hypothetical protein COW63_11705 [Bacteroidetes bacterium CG18_big_fil_WC_8_21_14_2_50_41_14]PJB58080.1 MAG: hypothetical protein CO098_10215 [Bacteroidetes bacterium CG_4_9_14_3_um_filter_41_19]